MAYLFKDLEEKERITYLEKEITRLQELCRNNFGVIADLKKENDKLNEIQLELKETTSDLAYSLAECPWLGLGTPDDERHGPSTAEAFRVLVTYAKNIQYILQLPVFFDPVEQFESYGMSREKAIRYLRMRSSRRDRKMFKCPKCKKDFTTEDRKNKHLEFHSNLRKKLHCTQCNKYIQSFRSFKSHLQSHEYMNQMMSFPSIEYHPKDHLSITQISSPPESNPEPKSDMEAELDSQNFKQLDKSNENLLKSNHATEDMDCEVLEIIPKKIKLAEKNVEPKDPNGTDEKGQGEMTVLCRLNILN